MYAATLTGSPGLIAGVTLAMTLPWALVSLPAGLLIDRVDRRRALAAANLARLVVLGALLAAGGAQPLVLLYAAAFALGACETVCETGVGALVPAVVPRGRLEWANTRVLGVQTLLHELVGPPLAGLLLAAGVALALGAGAAAYAVVALAALTLPATLPRAARRPRPGGGELLAGLRFLRAQPVLRTLTLMVAVMAAGCGAWQAVLVSYALRGPMHLDAVGYGVLLSLLAAGGLAGALMASRVQRALGLRAAVVADIVATTVMLGTPALTASPAVVGAAIVIGGAGSGMWNVVAVSLRQRLTPDELLGRVGASTRMLGWGAIPVGAAAGGAVAQLAGPRAAFAIASAASALLLAAFARRPRAWERLGVAGA